MITGNNSEPKEMTDLIKRLREFRVPVASTACCGGTRARPIIHPRICDEAADVIEQLMGFNKLVQRLQEFRAAVQDYAIHPAICDEAAAQIEDWGRMASESMRAYKEGRSQSVQEIIEELKEV